MRRPTLAQLLSLLLLAGACGGAQKPDTAAVPPGPPQPAAPAVLKTPDPPAAAIATFRARVYVDQDARKLPDWQARADDLMRRLNAFAGPAFGMKLDVEVKEWERKAPPTDLVPILQELAVADPAGDADWIIGITAPAPTPQTAHHKLGLAAVPGKHVLVRAIADGGASDEANRHKELVVLLHEVAHSAGALHEGDATSILSLAYDLGVSTLPPAATELARLGVQIRAAESRGDRARAGELWGSFATTLEKATALQASERGPLLERAKKLAAGTSGGAALSAEDKAAFDAATEAAKSSKPGDRVAAAKSLDALLAKVPNDASLRNASGAIYANAGAFTKAEAIMQDPAAKARVLASRRFYGLPPDGGRFQVTPDLEPDYVALFEDAHDALTKNQTKALAQKAAAGLKRFPGAPGLLALACGAELKAGKKPRAKKQCDAALAAWDETVLAHFFAGQIDPGPAGTKHLERVLELDPTLDAQVKPLLEKRNKRKK
jgi:hypothetical protein